MVGNHHFDEMPLRLLAGPSLGRGALTFYVMGLVSRPGRLSLRAGGDRFCSDRAARE